MSYDVPLRVLSLTPTRDGLANPSRRLPDKHERVFCGKTLNEWTMIQLWSSRHVSRAVFVCETEAHADRLRPLAERYGVELMVRNPELLHPHNDSGSIVMTHTLGRILAQDYYSLLMTPFVISPCRPPGFIDWLVDEYLRRAFADGGDFTYHAPTLLCGWQGDSALWQIENGIAHKVGPASLTRQTSYLFSTSQHWIGATWWYMGQMVKWFARDTDNPGDYKPMMAEIEPWIDLHIDTEQDWEEAEYWFRKKILSQGQDCYARYRESWEGGLSATS